MIIKTYPLQFTKEYLEELKREATKNGMSLKEFMLTAIDEKLKKGGK